MPIVAVLSIPYRRSWLSSMGILLLAVSAARAQRQDRASALLPRDHWAITALRRMEAINPTSTGSDFSANTFSQLEVSRRLRMNADSLASNPQWSDLSRAYLERFEEEFPATRLDSIRSLQSTGASLFAGVVQSTGRAAPGNGWIPDEDWTGAQPLADLQTPRAMFALSGTAGRFMAGQLAGSIADGEKTLAESHLLGKTGVLEVWLGRRTWQFGPASQGIVLGGQAELDAVGFQLGDPIRLPWLLRHLGPMRFETLLSRFDRNGIIADPWFWAARGSIQPARTFTIGINRASIFGGEGNPIRLVDLLEMIAGGYAGEGGEFENQVVSVDLRWVLPRLPAELYVEWGADDGAGMWRRAPGFTIGGWLHALPGTTAGFSRVEFTRFRARPQGGNTYWYRNVYFRGSWSRGEVPLGHELGGHGKELSLLLGTDLLSARVRLRGATYVRDRGNENVYAPERAGKSTGFALQAVWRVRRIEAELTGDWEDGDHWQRRALSAGLRSFF